MRDLKVAGNSILTRVNTPTPYQVMLQYWHQIEPKNREAGKPLS